MLSRQRKNGKTLFTPGKTLFTARGLLDSEKTDNDASGLKGLKYGIKLQVKGQERPQMNGQSRSFINTELSSSESDLSSAPTDELSSDPTIYEASEDDELEALEANLKMGCFDNLFFSEQRDPSDSLIQFNKVGREVQVNMKLPVPIDYIDRLRPSGSDLESAMEKFNCKGQNPFDRKCDLDFGQTYRVLDDQIIEMDHEKHMPQFFQSLLSLSEGSSEEECEYDHEYDHGYENFPFPQQQPLIASDFRSFHPRGPTPLNRPRMQDVPEVPPIYSLPSQILIQEQPSYGGDSLLSFEMIMDPEEGTARRTTHIDRSTPNFTTAMDFGRPMLSVDSEESDYSVSLLDQFDSVEDKENGAQVEHVVQTSKKDQVFHGSRKSGFDSLSPLTIVDTLQRDLGPSLGEGGRYCGGHSMVAKGAFDPRNMKSAKMAGLGWPGQQGQHLKALDTNLALNTHERGKQAWGDEDSIEGDPLLQNPWIAAKRETFDLDDQMYPSFDEGPTLRKTTPAIQPLTEKDKDASAKQIDSAPPLARHQQNIHNNLLSRRSSVHDKTRDVERPSVNKIAVMGFEITSATESVATHKATKGETAAVPSPQQLNTKGASSYACDTITHSENKNLIFGDQELKSTEASTMSVLEAKDEANENFGDELMGPRHKTTRSDNPAGARKLPIGDELMGTSSKSVEKTVDWEVVNARDHSPIVEPRELSSKANIVGTNKNLQNRAFPKIGDVPTSVPFEKRISGLNTQNAERDHEDNELRGEKKTFSTEQSKAIPTEPRKAAAPIQGWNDRKSKPQSKEVGSRENQVFSEDQPQLEDQDKIGLVRDTEKHITRGLDGPVTRAMKKMHTNIKSHESSASNRREPGKANRPDLDLHRTTFYPSFDEQTQFFEAEMI
jgi:hypothetical protein